MKRAHRCGKLSLSKGLKKKITEAQVSKTRMRSRASSLSPQDSYDRIQSTAVKVSPIHRLPETSTHVPISVGLTNFGHNCYINVIIQLLFTIQLRIRHDDGHISNSQTLNPESECRDHLRRLFQEMDRVNAILRTDLATTVHRECPMGILSPRAFLNFLQSCPVQDERQAAVFQCQEQQDAHEFLFALFDTIDWGGSTNDSISNRCKGQISFTVKCLECDSRTAATTEDFRCIHLSDVIWTSSSSKNVLSGMRTDKLFGSNKFHCSVCNIPTEARRHSQLLHVPVFLLCVNTTRCISSPIQDCFEWQGNIYHLIALVLHQGTSPHSGHYIIRIQEDQPQDHHTCENQPRRWIEIDDEVSYEIPSPHHSSGRNKGSVPYLLAYHRQ